MPDSTLNITQRINIKLDKNKVEWTRYFKLKKIFVLNVIRWISEKLQHSSKLAGQAKP